MANPYHKPAGSPEGGEFASAHGGISNPIHMQHMQHVREAHDAQRRAAVGQFDYSNPALSASDVAMRLAELRDIQPRPINKLWNDPSKAPPERVAEQQVKIKQWNSEYRKATKLQKQYLERDNAAFRARNGG